MELDTVIAYEEAVAEEMVETANYYRTELEQSDYSIRRAQEYEDRADEHRQVADWLKELKHYRARGAEWVGDDTQPYCSNCGNYALNGLIIKTPVKSNYCPMCGYRMVTVAKVEVKLHRRDEK